MTQLSERWLDQGQLDNPEAVPNFCDGCRKYWEEKDNGQQIVYSYASVFTHVPRVLCPRCHLKARVVQPADPPPGTTYEKVQVWLCPRCGRYWKRIGIGRDHIWAADGSLTTKAVIQYCELPELEGSRNNICPFCE